MEEIKLFIETHYTLSSIVCCLLSFLSGIAVMKYGMERVTVGDVLIVAILSPLIFFIFVAASIVALPMFLSMWYSESDFRKKVRSVLSKKVF